MGIEVNTNNPLGLTVAGPGYGNPTASLYPGQTGAQTSAYGYTFAQFPTQQTGVSAGIDYIKRKIASGAATTAGQLVNLFSPADQSAFTAVTGLQPGATLDPTQAGLYAAGIASGEGTLAAFGGTSAFTGTGATSQTGPADGTSTSTTTTPAPSSGGSSSSNSLNPIKQFEAWLTNISGSVLFVVLGIIFLIAALYMLAVQQGVAPSPKELGEAALAAG